MEASVRVMNEVGIGSTVICSDVGDKELLRGLLGPPIDEPGILCGRVRVRVAGEAEVCPGTVTGGLGGNGGGLWAIWSKENKGNVT